MSERDFPERSPEGASPASPPSASRRQEAATLDTLRIIFRPLAVKMVNKARQIAMTKIFADATDEIADEIAMALRWSYYPHMCRDEHEQIGHWDGEVELCPLCRALAKAEDK